MEGPIFGRAYVQREICIIKSVGLACSGKAISHFCFVLLCTRGQILSTSPPGDLYSDRRFNRGFLCYDFGGAYICRGLYMEGLIFRILPYHFDRKGTPFVYLLFAKYCTPFLHPFLTADKAL